MSGVPTEEQLRRIRAGVLGRIDRRRAVARRIAGSAAAVVLIGGGVGLLVSLGGIGVGASSGGGASGSRAQSAEVVRCHASARADSPSTLAKADPARLPGSAADACAAQAEARSSRSTPSPGSLAVCRDDDKRLHVFPGPSSVCTRNGMNPLP